LFPSAQQLQELDKRRAHAVANLEKAKKEIRDWTRERDLYDVSPSSTMSTARTRGLTGLGCIGLMFKPTKSSPGMEKCAHLYHVYLFPIASAKLSGR
jgi:hypothetical protein